MKNTYFCCWQEQENCGIFFEQNIVTFLMRLEYAKSTSFTIGYLQQFAMHWPIAMQVKSWTLPNKCWVYRFVIGQHVANSWRHPIEKCLFQEYKCWFHFGMNILSQGALLTKFVWRCQACPLKRFIPVHVCSFCRLSKSFIGFLYFLTVKCTNVFWFVP